MAAAKEKPIKLNCGGRCLKYFLAIFNIVIFILGLTIAGVAGFAAIDKNSKIHDFLTFDKFPQLDDGLYILLAVGLFLAFISFFGILGSLRESRCILFFYLIILVLIFVVQLVGIIISFVEFHKIETKILSVLKEPMSNDTSSADAELTAGVTAAVEAIEKKFKCCGITGPSNYGAKELPASCYAPPSTQATGDESIGSSSEYTEGCVVVVRPYLYAAGGIAIAVLLLQVLLMIFTCCLMSNIKKGYEQV